MADKPKRTHRKVKAGEIAASTGKPRRSPTAKRNPKVNQATWRTKLQQARIKFDDDAKQIFLTEFANSGLKMKSATAAGVCLVTVNNHLKNDPEFAEMYDEAQGTYKDKFLEHAMGLAYDGIKVTKFNKDGVPIEERQDYPIRLIELEMKRIEPGYREKQTIDVNAGGGGVLVAPAEMTPEQWVEKQRLKNKDRNNPMLTAPVEKEQVDIQVKVGGRVERG